MSKRVEYDPHAVDQMQDRGFRRYDVRRLLAEGTPAEARQYEHSDPVFAKQGYLGKREAKVLYLEDARRIYVITVMEILSPGALRREKARRKRGK